MKNETTLTRLNDREAQLTRTFDASARELFEAWTTPALLQQWWTPKSMGAALLECEVDARVGGTYRFLFGHGSAPPMAFFGTYTEVLPGERLVWTNEEGGETQITTVTFVEREGGTQVTVVENHPSKEALDGAIEMAMEACSQESHAQLDELLRARKG